MKRPSEVPPVVDSTGVTPVSARIAALSASLKRAGRREERLAARQSRRARKSRPWRSSTACTRDFSDSGVDSVAEAEVEVHHHARPGSRCNAPVPPWMLDTCQRGRREVGVAAVPFGGAPARPAPAPVGGSGCAPAAGRRCGPARRARVSLHDERAAAPVLDHVAERLHRGRLADDAAVELLAARSAAPAPRCTVPSTDGPSSSLVISSATRTSVRRVLCARRTPRLATTIAAIEVFMSAAPRPVQAAVAVRRHEGVAAPLRRAGRWAPRRCGRPAPRSGRAVARGGWPTGC